MNAEFNWWLLIVGLVIGAAVVYLVLADASRRESEVAAEELPREATWIATVLRAEGVAIEPRTAERVLELHRLYLGAPPPDEADGEDDGPAPEPDGGSAADGDRATDSDADASHADASHADVSDGAGRASAPGDDPHVERH